MKFLRKITYPISLLYNLITSTRNYLYNTAVFKSVKFKTPTIVVGNLSVGGTGKTPQIEYLVRLLKNNYKLAILSRGYKRKSKGFLIANDKSTVADIGDEPYQYYQKFKNTIVSVDANRTNGIQQLESLKKSPDVILLDDAFQHRKVRGGFNILLTSFNNLYVDDYLLPSGNLRENSLGAKRAQAIVVTKCPNNLSESEQLKITKKLKPAKDQQVFFTTIEYDTNLKGAFSLNLSDLKANTEALLITGIANPNPLTTYLKSQKISFKHLEYPDHHNFTSKDIATINLAFESLKSKNKILLTTEKDYVRIFGKLKKVHYIAIKTKFVSRKSDFDNLIKKYVEQSSRNG